MKLLLVLCQQFNYEIPIDLRIGTFGNSCPLYIIFRVLIVASRLADVILRVEESIPMMTLIHRVPSKAVPSLPSTSHNPNPVNPEWTSNILYSLLMSRGYSQSEAISFC